MPESNGPGALHVFDAKVPADDGTLLACRVWEPDPTLPAHGPVAVLHHGVGYYGAAYGRLGAFLARRGMPLCALDARGHGRSGGERGKLASGHLILEDLHAVTTWVHARYPNRPLLLIGDSMGGLFVLNYAARFDSRAEQVAALLLVAPGLLIHPRQVAHFTVVRRTPQARRDPTDQGEAMRTWQAALAGSRDSAWLQAREHDPLVLPNVGGRYMWIISVMSMRTPVAAARWSGPTLILHGKRDGVVPYQGSVMLYHLLRTPDKELALFPDVWHSMFWDPDTSEVLARISAWLDARFPIAAA
jgi:alpha-beta hydrolase superfamily lysophospholipase